MTHCDINGKMEKDSRLYGGAHLEENKNESLKAKLTDMGFTIKGLKILLIFSFIATILAFSLAFVEHRQYTELVDRYDDAIVKISEYQSSMAEFIDNAPVTETHTQPTSVTATTEAEKVTENKSEAYTAKTTTAKSQEVTTEKAETTRDVKETASAYYVTQSGKKYHVASCSYLSKSKIAISVDRIKAEGYTPCSRCIK